MAETNDVKQESSPASALEQAIASSPEVTTEAQQTQETQTPAKEEVTQEQETPQAEEARVPYSRLKEVVDEKNYFRQLWEQERQRQLSQQQFQQPAQDPDAGKTPEEREFWRAVREEAKKVAQSELQQVRPVIDAGRMELAQMKVQQFRVAHPDIKSNSPDEIEIAQRIQMGYLPEDAYWSVMGPRGIKVAQEQGKQQVKQQIEAKKKANVESSSSVPLQAQPQTKKSFRDDFLKNLQLAEEGKL